MNVLFLAKNTSGNEIEHLFKIENKNDNPAVNIAKEGENIQADKLFSMIWSIEKSAKKSTKEIRDFCLNALVQQYFDIQYHWEGLELE